MTDDAHPDPGWPEPTAATTMTFTLWFRAGRRAKWKPVAEAATERAASALIGTGGRRNGAWLTLPTGRDANAKAAVR